MEETWFVLGEGRSVIRSLSSSSLDLADAIGLIIVANSMNASSSLTNFGFIFRTWLFLNYLVQT